MDCEARISNIIKESFTWQLGHFLLPFTGVTVVFKSNKNFLIASISENSCRSALILVEGSSKVEATGVQKGNPPIIQPVLGILICLFIF